MKSLVYTLVSTLEKLRCKFFIGLRFVNSGGGDGYGTRFGGTGERTSDVTTGRSDQKGETRTGVR